MQDAFHQAAADFGAEVVVNVKRMYETYRLEEDHAVLQISQAAARNLGMETGLRQAGGGSDANVFNAFGWPTCVLATGMRQIHTHHECIAIADLVSSAKWLIEIVQETVRRAGNTGA